MTALDNYKEPKRIYAEALKQLSEGKGKERHAKGEPFEEQLMMLATGMVGVGGPLFQAIKKAVESQRLPYPRNVNELYGAMNYLVGAVLEYEKYPKKEL